MLPSCARPGRATHPPPPTTWEAVLTESNQKRGLYALESKRRATGRVQALFFLQSNLKQARGTKTGDWIGCLHRLTLKNPARHRDS